MLDGHWDFLAARIHGQTHDRKNTTLMCFSEITPVEEQVMPSLASHHFENVGAVMSKESELKVGFSLLMAMNFFLSVPSFFGSIARTFEQKLVQ